MQEQKDVFLSSAYLAPIQYYSKLYHFRGHVFIEACEHYCKQTYRNRCNIAQANGILSLSVPIIKPSELKTPTKDIQISDHGNWRHLHWNAFVSAYNMSPFFEYYQDDFAPFYEKKYKYLFDFNEKLQTMICELIGMPSDYNLTNTYEAELPNDFRESISPKKDIVDDHFVLQPYYQVFQNKYGFQPNLSIVDLLFNMGPESIIVLKNSYSSNEI